MADELLTFRRFNDPGEARALSEILSTGGIPNQIEDASPVFDVSYSNNPLLKEYRIMLLQEDFQRAQARLDRQALQDGELPEAGHYLNDFSETELLEVLGKADEWNETDVHFARNLLAVRGIKPDVDALRKKRAAALARPEKPQTTWVVIGYIALVLGGVLAIYIGMQLETKRTLPDGTSVYAYNDTDRRHGQILRIGGILVVAGSIVVLIGKRVLGYW